MKLGKGAFLPIKNPLTGGFRLLYCFDMGGPKGRVCWRAMDHTGRHADIGDHGDVRAVWGEDVHAKRRVTSRVTAAFREIPRILRIETAHTWDGVAR